MTFATTLDQPYCPLRARKRSDLRSKPSSETTSETIGFSSEIDSLGEDLGDECAIVLEELEEPPETLTKAAELLGLGSCQSASHRLNRLATRFPMSLLKEGKRLTAIGWDLMKKLDPKLGLSVDDLWAEYQKAAPEPERHQVVEVEIVDPNEVGAAIIMRTQSLLATIEEEEIPTIQFNQHFEGMLAYAAAVGEKAGQQMAMVQLKAMAKSFQATLNQAQLGGIE